MEYYKTGNKVGGNFGSVILTLAAVVLSFIFSQLGAEIIAQKVFGFSLTNIPENIDSNVVFTLMLIPFFIVFIVLISVVNVVHGQSVRSLFTSREHFSWKRFFISFGIWGAFLFGIMGIDLIFGEEIQWNFDGGKFFILMLISLTLLPIQTTVEELIFRGYLFQQLSKVFPRAWFSILITGTIFGLMHGANPEVAKLGSMFLIYYVITGIFLGIITHMDNGLELSMGYHAVNNIFAALIITNDWQVFQTDALLKSVSEPPHGIEVVITICIVQPLLLFLYSKILKWKDWKTGLFS